MPDIHKKLAVKDQEPKQPVKPKPKTVDEASVQKVGNPKLH